MKVKSLSRVRLFVTPWTVAHQALLSMGFSRQEYWSGLPFLPPGDLPDPGIERIYLMSLALTVAFFMRRILYEADSSVVLSEKLGHIQFSWQEYWSGLSCPPPRDLPNPGTEPTSPVSPALQMDSLPAEPQGKPGPMAYPWFITCG